VLGDVLALLTVLVAAVLLFLLVASRAGARFASLVLAATSVPRGASEPMVAARAFRVEPPADALRRKEVLLILRDPWLVSQSLMQLLYLVPPAALLWHSYAIASGTPVVVVPVLAMASGQLAGALAWLTICGEDAPDLVLTAPVAPERLLLSKLEAVMLCVGVVFLPLVAGLMTVSTTAGVVALLTIAASASSATAIQFWFRAQARRSQFRRRHASSRIATLSEAFSSVLWAAAAGTALAGSDLWPAIVLMSCGFLGAVWRASPSRVTR
jgi:ABC-2 type transport system permease protein